MSRLLEFPGFQPSQIKEQLCHFWCQGLEIQPLDGVLSIQTPAVWPDGDPIYAYLEEDESGALWLSDWHHILGELYLQGIHSSPSLVGFALSRGFQANKQGELRRQLDGLEDLPHALMDYIQVAAIALSDMEGIRFEPAPLVLPVTWGGVLASGIERPGILLQAVSSRFSVDKKKVVRNGTVAMHNHEPLVVSPYIKADNRGWADMAALFQDAVDSLRGVVPLVKVKDEARFKEFREDLKDAGKRHVRSFLVDAVPVYVGEDQFDPAKNAYPGVQLLKTRVGTFAKILDQVLAGQAA